MAAVKTVFVHSVKKEYIVVVVRETDGYGHCGAAGGHAKDEQQLNVLLDALALAPSAPGVWQKGRASSSTWTVARRTPEKVRALRHLQAKVVRPW